MSESNLWLGFSQDMAEGGVFVATYDTRPLGTRGEIALHLDKSDDEGEPIALIGNVHWVRPSSAGEDLPAGVGVRLTNLTTEVAQRLEAFAARRTPIFYDD
jgi:Tfp pilus assembly protein PilZ